MHIKESSFHDDLVDKIKGISKPGLYLNNIHYPFMIEQIERVEQRFYTKLSRNQLDELIRNAYLLYSPTDEQKFWLRENNINFIENPREDGPIYTKVTKALLKLGYEDVDFNLYSMYNSSTPPLFEETQKLHLGDFTHWYYKDPENIYIIKGNEWIILLDDNSDDKSIIRSALYTHDRETVNENRFKINTLHTSKLMYDLVDTS